MLTVRMCIKALQAPLSRKRSPFFPGLSSTWMGTQWSKHVLTNFFSEINLLASGLLRASELSFGDFPFIKHSEQKQSSRIIAQCLQHLLGGGWIKFPCVLYFFWHSWNYTFFTIWPTVDEYLLWASGLHVELPVSWTVCIRFTIVLLASVTCSLYSLILSCLSFSPCNCNRSPVLSMTNAMSEVPFWP